METSTENERFDQIQKIKDRVRLESEVKLKFFMVGLIFAILSFAIQSPVESGPALLKTAEAACWAMFAGAGIFSIRDIGGFSVESNDVGLLSRKEKSFMWFLFLSGLYGLIIVKMTAQIGYSS
jgi:hypothetical protein